MALPSGSGAEVVWSCPSLIDTWVSLPIIVPQGSITCQPLVALKANGPFTPAYQAATQPRTLLPQIPCAGCRDLWVSKRGRIEFLEPLSIPAASPFRLRCLQRPGVPRRPPPADVRTRCVNRPNADLWRRLSCALYPDSTAVAAPTDRSLPRRTRRPEATTRNRQTHSPWRSIRTLLHGPAIVTGAPVLPSGSRRAFVSYSATMLPAPG